MNNRGVALVAVALAFGAGMYLSLPKVKGAQAQQNSSTPASTMAGPLTPTAAGLVCGPGMASLNSASQYIQTSLTANQNSIHKCVTTDGITYAWQAPFVAATPSILGATASIGGGALLLGGSISGTATVTGAAVGSNCIATRTDGTLLAVGMVIDCAVGSANTATVRISALIAGTPTAGTYAVRVVN